MCWLTVKRARRDGLKISVCSGGHSWMQSHLREGGLLIDMSHINQIEVDVEQRVAIAGPGCWSVDLDNRLKRDALFFPIAHAVDVCLGGYLLQGGFGWSSRVLGLACENVMGMDVVTADGELIHASEQENADLFWAARGAGPGFFGVVVRYHLQVHTRPRVTALALHVFSMKHLDEVFLWAEKVGPEVPRSVEFQLLLTRTATGIFAPGIEVIAMGLHHIATTLPPMPSHVLMISWHPPAQRKGMAFSLEGKHYLALYGEWKNESDDATYGSWATDNMHAMAPLSAGIQLADENLGRRRARFMLDANFERLQSIRAKYDPLGLFHTYKGF